jgi:hypothetical protein
VKNHVIQAGLMQGRVSGAQTALIFQRAWPHKQATDFLGSNGSLRDFAIDFSLLASPVPQIGWMANKTRTTNLWIYLSICPEHFNKNSSFFSYS